MMLKQEMELSWDAGINALHNVKLKLANLNKILNVIKNAMYNLMTE
jgi:hypothetical protein